MKLKYQPPSRGFVSIRRVSTSSPPPGQCPPELSAVKEERVLSLEDKHDRTNVGTVLSPVVVAGMGECGVCHQAAVEAAVRAESQRAGPEMQGGLRGAACALSAQSHHQPACACSVVSIRLQGTRPHFALSLLRTVGIS